jgi:hypothetical protein
MADALPSACLRITHDNSRVLPAARGCEVLIEGEPVAQLEASGYTVHFDVAGTPVLEVRIPLAEIGDLVTFPPERRASSLDKVLERIASSPQANDSPTTLSRMWSSKRAQ